MDPKLGNCGWENHNPGHKVAGSSLGGAYLFPSPISPDQPIRYELASDWLMKAEKLAEVPKQRGSLWHAYRRKWATERKHLPDVDVAAAGGWTETDSLKQCYQQADEATMLRVVLSGGQLRESKGQCNADRLNCTLPCTSRLFARRPSSVKLLWYLCNGA